MKRTLVLLSLFCTYTLYSQDFKEKFGQDICKCLGEKDSDINNLKTCFVENLEDYQSDIEALIDKESDLSEHEQGQILGNQIFNDMQADLIHNCDAYYNYFQELREKTLLDKKEISSESMIDSLSIEIAKNKTLELLWKRGNTYFALGQLPKAKADYKECLKMDSNHLQSTMFLAWTYEREEKYSKAIKLYTELYDKTQKPEFNVLLELAKRNSKL